MSFQTREISPRSGAPVELYLVTVGLDAFYWTSADEPVTYLGKTYTPAPIVRGELTSGDETADGELEVSVPLDHQLNELLQIYRSGLTPLGLTIFGGHRGDVEYWTIFSGRSLGILVEDAAETGSIKFRFVRLEGLMRRKLPRMQYGRTCQNMLYDQRCKMIPANYAFDSVITDFGSSTAEVVIDGFYAYCSSKNSDFLRFNGGVLLRDNRPQGFIVAWKEVDTIRLLDQNPSLKRGQTVRLVAGCDRSIQTCWSRFANVRNFNGWHTIPQTNPFDGLTLEESAGFRGDPSNPNDPTSTPVTGGIGFDPRGW